MSWLGDSLDMGDHGVVDRRQIACEAAKQLVAAGDADAVVLHGSVARGSDRPDSDVDLLAVCNGERSFRRSMGENNIEIEVVSDSETGWTIRFGDARPMWLYAWSEGEVLIDTDDVAAALKRRADGVLRTYRTPEEVRAELREFWKHVQPKVRATHARGDDQECGFVASTLTEKLVETVFAVHDRPPPPGSLRFILVRELLVHEPNGQTGFKRLLTGEPRVRLEAVINLSDLYLQSLEERLTSFH